MTYSVNHHWDKLNVCVVGNTYPPEFYNFIKDSRLRSFMEKISSETLEDINCFIKFLKAC